MYGRPVGVRGGVQRGGGLALNWREAKAVRRAKWAVWVNTRFSPLFHRAFFLFHALFIRHTAFASR
jgi:hypothetical protein